MNSWLPALRDQSDGVSLIESHYSRPLSVLGSGLESESNKASLFRSTLGAMERIEIARIEAPVEIARIRAMEAVGIARETTRQVTAQAMAGIHLTAIQCSIAPSADCSGVDIETTHSEGGFFSKKTRMVTRIRRF